MEKSYSGGFLAGASEGVKGSTVILPYILGAVAGIWLPASRDTAIWIQAPWVFFLMLSIYCYCRVILHAERSVAAVLAIPFACTNIAFQVNGGLSDFRMDYHLYLLYGCATVWFLMALYSISIKYWIISGIFCGLTCLSRATAPIYLIITFCPILLVFLLRNRQKIKERIAGLMVMSAIAASISGWFYIVNIKYLYYYYAVWNVDAKANLPFRDSLNHFNYAITDTGIILVYSIFLVSIAVFTYNKIANGTKFNWRHSETLFVAFAPAGFLAIKGAGLNPFVSMPSAFGILLVIISIPGVWSIKSNYIKCAVFVIIIGACLQSAIPSIALHRSNCGLQHYKQGYIKILENIEIDAASHHLKEIKVGSVGGNYLSLDVLYNILLFDRGFRGVRESVGNGVIKYNLSTPYSYIFAPVEWRDIPGDTDLKKTDYIAKNALQSTDYLILPSQETIQYLEKKAIHLSINNHLSDIYKKMISSNNWVAVSGNITITPQESYIIYRNSNIIH